MAGVLARVPVGSIDRVTYEYKRRHSPATVLPAPAGRPPAANSGRHRAHGFRELIKCTVTEIPHDSLDRQVGHYIEMAKSEKILIAEMEAEAVRFITSYSWCPDIISVNAEFSVVGIFAEFLFHFSERIYGTDDALWVVVGDVPSAYLVLRLEIPQDLRPKDIAILWSNGARPSNRAEICLMYSRYLRPQQIITQNY